MREDVLKTLEYEQIRDELAQYVMSYLGRKHVQEMNPKTNVSQIEAMLRETEEALAIVSTGSSVPIPRLDGVESIMLDLEKGFVLTTEEVSAISQLIRSGTQLRRYMQKRYDIAPGVARYSASISELASVVEELERCVMHQQVTNQASDGLAKVRKRIGVIEERLKKKLDALLHKHRSILQERIVTRREGRYVLAVKRTEKRAIQGAIVDTSASGQTIFVEPAELGPLQTELAQLLAVEEYEQTLVLAKLTELIDANRDALRVNLEVIGHYDFLVAKARYAKHLGARRVRLNPDGQLDIRRGRHPLLRTNVVPLDIRIGGPYRTLVITGPNTGGKTVSLKTVGLLCLMVQSGLLVPAEGTSEFPVYSEILADIGDGQSIEHSLSTFSAHVTNVIDILNEANSHSLVLLDELASGTDPGEGVGLSIAVLEELFARGATVLASTHFSEIKNYALVTDGFEVARMEFDIQTLSPLYRLHLGEAGQSYALEVAQKLGVPGNIIERSRQISSRRAQPVETLESDTVHRFGMVNAMAETAVRPRHNRKNRKEHKPKEKP